MTLIGTAKIYTGVWTNYSQGPFLGCTITLKEVHGAVLQAFLTVLLGSAGQAFWIIISYSVHQYRSKPRPHRPIFYQQQVVLRNSGTAFTAALRMGQLSFAWRASSRKFALYSFFYMCVAMVISVGFLMASVFFPSFTKGSSDAMLLRPTNCGFWLPGDTITTSSEQASRIMLKDSEAVKYAGNCYKERASDLRCNSCFEGSIKSVCSSYTVGSIGRLRTSNTSCPFASDACKSSLGYQAALMMDTGYIDTALTLGINGKSSERLLVRKVATCAPLNLKKYQEKENQTYVTQGETKSTLNRRYKLGRRAGSNTNWTYEFNQAASSLTPGYQLR